MRWVRFAPFPYGLSFLLAFIAGTAMAAATHAADSVLIPAPIAETDEHRNAWGQPGTQAISIQDERTTGKYAADDSSEYVVDDGLTLAPLPDGMTHEPLETSAIEPVSLWPEWIGNGFACDSCGQTTCSCGKSNHGIFGNLFDRRHGCWVGRFDSLILWRNAPQSRPLFNTGNATALDADQIESDVLAAPRISFFHVNECGYGAEFTYIYAGNFYGEQNRDANTIDSYAAPGIYGITSPAPIAATATLLGRFQSFEANSRTPIASGNIQFISGFRWIQWQEELRVSATGTSPSPTANYLTNCFNDLYGGQIGFDTLLYQSNGGIRLEGLVKAGAYYNQAVQHSSTDSASVAESGTPAAGSFAGEVGLTGVMPITRNWDFRIGYFGVWLEAIAQPSWQLSQQNLSSTPPTGGLSTVGNMVLQGVSLGVEGRW